MVAREAGMQKPIFKWLKTNAPKFGFIPYVQMLTNKNIRRGEIVEPWHWEMSPANAKAWAEFDRHPNLPKK
jgi:LAS superfamily LD-carboxypeptidase LdcB